jgi:hypothetical protein
MNADDVLQLLERIKAGVLTPAEGVQKLAAFPYEDLEFAKIDHHRELRTGLPEVIFAAGKTEAQVLEIFAGMVRSGNNVLATRVTPAMGRAVSSALAASASAWVTRPLRTIKSSTGSSCVWARSAPAFSRAKVKIAALTSSFILIPPRISGAPPTPAEEDRETLSD